jgi:hypothetical protein
MKKLLIGVLAAALSLAACGGSSKKTVDAAGGPTTTAKDGSTASTSGSTGSGSDDLSKLAGEYAKARIKITYTSNTGGSEESLTIAQDGNGKTAFTTGSSTFYSDGTSSISCEGTGSSAKCTDLGSLGAASAGLGSIFTASFSALAHLFDQLGTGDNSSETIAGRDASCVTYKASDFLGKLKSLPLFQGEDTSGYDPNDSATICVDKKSGFLLKVSSTKKGVNEETFVATEVGEPSDSDFTPPATPETLPKISLPDGVTLPDGITLPGSGG